MTKNLKKKLSKNYGMKIMKKINQRKITLFVLFLYTLGILTFGNIFDDTLNIREEGTLNINEPNDETSFILGIDYLPGIDPHSSNGYEFSAVIDQVVETLLAYNLSDPELSIIPRLAVSKGIWSGDGLSYTIQLKTGVKFHDGTNFDASAVKWSFDRLAYFMNISGSLPPTQNTPYFDYIYRWDDGTPIINRTEVLNTDLIKFVLNQPYGAFEGLLSISSSGILSPTSTSATEYIEYLTDDLVGTGPFVYDGYFNYYNDGEINFHAFEEYHQGITNITHLKYSIIHDSLALNNAILSGDIDAIYNPLSSMLDTFVKQSHMHLTTHTSLMKYSRGKGID